MLEAIKSKDLEETLESIKYGTFEFNFEDNDLMNRWEDYGFIKKDLIDGDTFNVKGLLSSNDKVFTLLCDNGIIVDCTIKKERDFFAINGVIFKTLEELIVWLDSDLAKSWFEENIIKVFIHVDKNKITPSLLEGHYESKKSEFIKQIKEPSKVYNARVITKNNGGFIVNILGINAFLPGSLAAANKIIDFDYYIEKEIPVMIEDYIHDGDTFIVSNKKYISHIIPRLIDELNAGDIITGTITGTLKFGIFVEFNDILTGLLHISEMSSDTYYRFKNNEFKAGLTKEVKIKEITKDYKIILTDKDEDSTVTMETFKEKCENTLSRGSVISIKPEIGAFIKFTLDDTYFIGLLHNKVQKEDTVLEIGQDIDVFITKVDCNDRKIFLKLPE